MQVLNGNEEEWFAIGRELNVSAEFLEELRKKARTNFYKLEETLSECSAELTSDNVLRVLEQLQLHAAIYRLNNI